MAFTVGQKVVCIAVPEGYGTDWCALPTRGAIYTIRWLGEFGDCRLVEVSNPILMTWCDVSGHIGRDEPSFACDQFRPIVERTTDISIFTEMLTPQSERV